MHLFCLSSCIISSWLICFWQVLDKSLPFLTLIAAGGAVYIAIQSKCQSKVAAQVNIFYQLMARYSSPEMYEAYGIIWELSDTRRQNEAAFLKVVKRYHDEEGSLSALMSNVEVGEPCELFRHNYEETHQAHCKVLGFFIFSFCLFTEFKVLDAVYFKKICSVDSFSHIYHVIEWLELALIPDYNRKRFTGLLEQSGRSPKEIEELEKLRPPETWAEVE